MRSAVLASLVLIAAAPALGRDRPIPEATPAGKPVDCLRITDLRQSQVRSDQVIDFYTRGGKIYRNTLPQSCPSLGFERSFSYRTSIAQLCSIDTIRVLSNTPDLQPLAACGLGKFQPVTLAKRAR
jgi:hypothetical protein